MSAPGLAPYQPVIAKIERIAREIGLAFAPVEFRMRNGEELAEIASLGLPGRFLHWFWGGVYKGIQAQQERDMFRILELVLNTAPSYAFLRNDNSFLQNAMVVAHVYGHADFFRMNHWYRQSNRGMIDQAERHARLIAAHERAHGREPVQTFLDAALTVAAGANAFERLPPRRRTQPVYWLLEHAPLAPHEYEILDAVRAEAEYFDLVQRTHVINEGWATFVECEVLRDVLSARDWAIASAEFGNRPFTYVLGYALFRRLHAAGGWPRVFEVRRDYEDVRFLDEFLDDEMVRRLDLFVVDPKDRSQVTDPAQVKDLLIRQKITKGEPPVVVADPEADELTLAHTEEDRTLDPRRIRGYLAAVHTIWQRSVRLRANGRVYVHDEAGFSTV